MRNSEVGKLQKTRRDLGIGGRQVRIKPRWRRAQKGNICKVAQGTAAVSLSLFLSRPCTMTSIEAG